MHAEHASSTVSLRRARLRARAPKAALLAACALLSVGGLRAAVLPPAPDVRETAAPRQVEGTERVAALAEAFVRAWLTWDARDPDAAVEAIVPFLSNDTDATIEPPAAGRQRVDWSAINSVVPDGPRRWLVTVAAHVVGERAARHVSVPVAADTNGRLVVSDLPAIVGAPIRGAAPAIDEPELTDQALADVAVRALGNYLAGNADNLKADLAPGTTLATPGYPLRLIAVDRFAWRSPGRVLAAYLTAAEPSGARVHLRFQLTVERSDRWYLRAVNDPHKETQ